MLYSVNSAVEEVQPRHASLLAKRPEGGVMWSSAPERTEDHWWEGWMRADDDAGHSSFESRKLLGKARLDEEPDEGRIHDGLLTDG
jgi:hypothetical protein